jgi:putative phosphoesterase
MRVAALADVHGNAVALEAVLAELAREQPDLIVSCGDLTWGPLPLETVALLEPWRERLLCVRGNSERELVERKLIDSEIAVWEHEQHDSPALDDYLSRTQAGVTVEVDGLGTTLFCHGSPRSDEELITLATPEPRIRALLDGVGERVLVSAHSHVQFDRTVAGIRSVNPGSVGMPYEGRSGAAFWALLGPDVELKRTDYDLDEAVRRYRSTDDPLAEQMVEILCAPPSRAEVVEHAEGLEFSG